MSLQATHDTGLLNTKKVYSYDNNINNWGYNFQNNISYKVTSTTKIDLHMNAQIRSKKGPNYTTSDLFKEVMHANPVNFPVTFPAEEGDTHVKFGNAILSGNNLYVNPYAYMLSSFKEVNENTLNTSLKITQQLEFITKGLSIQAMVNWKNWSQSSYNRTIEPYYYGVKTDSFVESDPNSYELQRLGTSGTDYLKTSDIGKSSKYTVYEAGNGEEGVHMAKEKLPDLIISDVMMPVKDGFTCCEEIRSQQETAHIPILMLTAKAEDADILQGSRSGADDYMMKPFNPEILKAKVDNLILQREQLKRIYTKALMLKQKSEEGEQEDAFLLQLIHVIEANIPNENFNVKMLAEQLNMSQPTLYRKVKQRSDLSVIDMIRSIRISKAASLILENRYSIQEITEMVGYSDTRTLRKHFTEHFGVSPSKYIGEK